MSHISSHYSFHLLNSSSETIICGTKLIRVEKYFYRMYILFCLKSFILFLLLFCSCSSSFFHVVVLLLHINDLYLMGFFNITLLLDPSSLCLLLFLLHLPAGLSWLLILLQGMISPNLCQGSDNAFTQCTITTQAPQDQVLAPPCTLAC